MSVEEDVGMETFLVEAGLFGDDACDLCALYAEIVRQRPLV